MLKPSSCKRRGLSFGAFKGSGCSLALDRSCAHTLFLMRKTLRFPPDAGDRITVLGILWNVLLLVLKLVVGLLTGSAGLVADGIHSASDMATDLAVLGGMQIARREPDERHPYGHGRFETLAGGVVAGALILVGAFLAWEAIGSLRAGNESFPGLSVIGVAMASLLAKEWLYRRTIRVARDVSSAALHANAWHHRSDALSSVAVLLGGIGGLIGWGQADHLAGLVVGLMVIVAGGRTLLSVMHELTEGGLGREETARIRAAVESVEGTCGWHHLRTRSVGRQTFVELHVLVDSELSIVDAHHIATDVEEAIHRTCSRPVQVMVHIEPDVDQCARHPARAASINE